MHQNNDLINNTFELPKDSRDSNLRLTPQPENTTGTSSAARLTMTPDWFVTYVEWLSKSNVSDASQREYLTRARQFLRFWRHESATSLEVAASNFIDEVRARQLRPRTVIGLIAVVEQIVALSERPPVRFERPVNTASKRRGTLTLDDENSLIECARRSAKNRELAIIMLMLRAGLEFGECRNLKVADISADGSSLTVGARNRTRAIELSREVSAVLQAWLEELRLVHSWSICEFVFFSDHGQISATALHVQLRKLGWRCGVPLTASLLRNTWKARSREKGSL